MATKYPYEEQLKAQEQASGSNWGQMAADYWEKYNNRQPFSYDVNNDALYQNYKNQYVQAGRRAMEDTMGQAAGLTGGYNSSYSQAVGQQQYNDYMTKLNAEIPNLYAQARSAYDKEGQELLDRYNIAMQMENQEYNRGRDALEDEWKQKEWDANQSFQQWQMDRQDRSDARDLALMMLQAGKLPSDDVLAAAGLSAADAQSMADYYRSLQMASGGSGGSGGGGGSYSGGGRNYDGGGKEDNSTPASVPTATPDYKGVRQTLYNLAKTGDYEKAIQILDNSMEYMTAQEQNDLINYFEHWFGKKTSQTTSGAKKKNSGGGGVNYNAYW